MPALPKTHLDALHSALRHDLFIIVMAGCGGAMLIPTARADLDRDGNQMSDVWQAKFGVGALAPAVDTDGDGYSNAQENLFGTNPVNPNSRPGLSMAVSAPPVLNAEWPGEPGKVYHTETSENLTSWTRRDTLIGKGVMLHSTANGKTGKPLFLRVDAMDVDTDGDGLSDWEESTTGFNPGRMFSEGLGSNPTTPTTNNPRITDKERLAALMTAPANIITVAAADSSMAENWPAPGRFVIHRTGRLDAITLAFSYGGTATNGKDYTAPAAIAVIPFGADETTISIAPLVDATVESTETVTLTLLGGTGYTLGTATSATINLADSSSNKPSTKAAARFLTQATYGPSPQELVRVMNLGYSAWLDDQFNRAPNLHLPLVQAWQAELSPSGNGPLVINEHRMEAWWRQSMRSDPSSDPLRQRLAFALSQIFVISDRMDVLAGDQRGMTSYYDNLLNNAFGTYRQLLEGVTRHPWMGIYLSSMKNRKANALANRFPDENYAREIMQLFSIGLWLLNPDGSLKLSNGNDQGPDHETIPAGQPIPTYGQSQIREIARIFTGMSYGTRFTSGTAATEIPATKFNDSSLTAGAVRGFSISYLRMSLKSAAQVRTGNSSHRMTS